jgi:Ca2+-binding EF-hand superfamily protein
MSLTSDSKIDWSIFDELLPTEKASIDTTTDVNDTDDAQQQQYTDQRRTIFTQYFDPNQNGYSSLAECDKGIQDLLRSSSSSSIPPEVIATIFTKPVIIRAFTSAKSIAQQQHGSDSSRIGNDYIDFSEFRSFLYYLKEYGKLWELFQTIDTNNDRRIDLNEFKNTIVPTLLLQQNSDYNSLLIHENENLDDIFQAIDTNHGGYILFIEFVEWVVQTKSNKGK